MRLSVVLSDGHTVGVDPVRALAADVDLVVAARERFDGITLRYGRLTAPVWNPQALTTAAYLAAVGDPLDVTVVDLSLDVLNPVELAEQLATVDHAWSGRCHAGLAGPRTGRFTDGLRVLRAMWAGRPFAGDGPEFRFAEVRPTLLPVRPEGPPLTLRVADAGEARAAAGQGLGVRVTHTTIPADRQVARHYAAAGGTGEIAVELAWWEATTAALRELAAAGVGQVDVRVREPGEGQISVLSTMDDLADRAAAAVSV
jgi:alkanesulfonate monooxygenase SsuD/methylene tetrahydromethanopterin reductase-like flavin-dependent oxidoreductase (luciferase family)